VAANDGEFVGSTKGGAGVLVGSALAAALVAPVVVSGSFLQPCISKAMSPTPWIASTRKTAILTRARPLFFWSSKEPWGTNGLWLFMVIGRLWLQSFEVWF
jgi:hypothetical protein